MLHKAALRKLDALQATGLLRTRRLAQGPTAVHQAIADPLPSAAAGGASAWAVQRPRLLFCSNDYLGLASHPLLVQALVEGAQRHGVGSGASHLISGHHQAHQDLEDALAQAFGPWVPQAQALGFSTGYMANLAVITGLAGLMPGEEVLVLSDALNHASLIDACRLSRATVQRYAHRNLADLELQLEAARQSLKLIVTDGVFSMDGDCADLRSLLALAERHDAWLVVDDAHGLGVLGERGLGLPEAVWPEGLPAESGCRLILVGTLGKAVGVAGAYVVAQADILQALLQTARSYIYTTAAPPALAHAALVSLQLVTGEEGRRRRALLAQRVSQWQKGLAATLGLATTDGAFQPLNRRPGGASAAPPLGAAPGDGYAVFPLPSDTPIQPLVVGTNARAMAWADALDHQGLRVPGIRPPTVPNGQARLRITFSAGHSEADVERLLAALQELIAP